MSTDKARPIESVLQWAKHQWPWFWRLLVGGLLILALAALLKGIVFAPTQIGSPATESDALIRANERLLEMVKWTLSTILLIGGLLIGLNWYSNEKRFDIEVGRIREELASKEDQYTKSLLRLQAEGIAHGEMILAANLDLYKLRSQIASTMLLQSAENIPGLIVDAAINAIKRPDAQQYIRDEILDSVVLQFENSDPKSSFTVYLGLDKLPDLAAVAAQLGHEEKSERILALYKDLDAKRKASR